MRTERTAPSVVDGSWSAAVVLCSTTSRRSAVGGLNRKSFGDAACRVRSTLLAVGAHCQRWGVCVCVCVGGGGSRAPVVYLCCAIARHSGEKRFFLRLSPATAHPRWPLTSSRPVSRASRQRSCSPSRSTRRRDTRKVLDEPYRGCPGEASSRTSPRSTPSSPSSGCTTRVQVPRDCAAGAAGQTRPLTTGAGTPEGHPAARRCRWRTSPVAPLIFYSFSHHHTARAPPLGECCSVQSLRSPRARRSSQRPLFMYLRWMSTR